MAFSFKGGIHPDYNKERTFASPIEELPEPEEVIIPLLQHIGAICEATVAKGDYVSIGQVIGDSVAPLSCPIHSSISGFVKVVEPRWHPNGIKVNSVVISNDFQDNIHESCQPFQGELDELTTDEIIKYARNSGIVGMGGAAFPLHAKLKAAIDKKIDTIIINGSECEPYITADHRAMIEYPRPIANGIKLIMKCLGRKEATIAIESNKPDALATMRITLENTGISVLELETKYPQGGEKQLIKAVTGREVPPGKLPMDIGCAVFNVDTCASLYRAIIRGIPLIKRVVTVSGAAVINPKNLLVRIGTPYYSLFEYCGGFYEDPYKIISGGPMMGSAQHSLETPVIKNTSALLAFSGDEEDFVENPTCIHCGRCVNVCPMRLMPNYIYMYAQKGEYDECKKLNVQDCIECGCCSYTCPGKLFLVQAMRMSKGKISR
ncbi:MAG: electron transport complex, RnfABCDGE type, subunit [Clostridia bacterium]|nr:electron transport complex, RnfABCDGE type, subunit [Clostridia bacterium]